MSAHIVRQYESWGAFVAAAEAGADRSGGSSYTGTETFTGTPSFRAAVELAHQGWPEPRLELTGLVDNIKDDLRPLLVDQFAVRYDVAGAAVDIDRYLHGEPECLIEQTPVKVAKPGRVIPILLSISASAAVRPEDIIRRGSAVVALVELLELLQHSTELWIESTSEASGRAEGLHTVLVKVKGADEKVDLDQIAFALAHPSTLRRLCFGVREGETPSVRQRFGFNDRNSSGKGGYGLSHDLTQAEAIGAAVVLDTRHYRIDPETWIRENLAQFGLLAEQH